MRMSIAIVLCALLGCAHTQSTQPPSPAQLQVDEAQSESEQAYDAARASQAHAHDLADQAASARRDAQQKQVEAKQAEQRAAQLEQQAQIAQQQAITAGQEAARRAQAAQQRALRLEPQAQREIGQQGPATMASGTLQSVGDDEIVIVQPGGAPLHLRIDPQHTSVVRDGRNVPVQELQPGTNVTVAYRIENERPVAATISTTSPPQTSEEQPDPNNPDGG